MYTVTQLVEILALHPKTVRRFIREGRIKAKKIGREWRVSKEDLRDFTHGELSSMPAGEPPSTTCLSDRIQVSAVIEIGDSHSSEVSRISNSLIAALNNKDPRWGAARYDLVYHPEICKARFILHGNPLFIRTFLDLVDVLMQQDNAAPKG